MTILTQYFQEPSPRARIGRVPGNSLENHHFDTTAPAERVRGTVIEWCGDRGFGFIEADSDRRRYFVHVSRLVGARKGDRVSFSVGIDRGSPANGRRCSVRWGPAMITALALFIAIVASTTAFVAVVFASKALEYSPLVHRCSPCLEWEPRCRRSASSCATRPRIRR